MRSDTVMIEICESIDLYRHRGELAILAGESGIDEERLKDISYDGTCDDEEYILLASRVSVL